MIVESPAPRGEVRCPICRQEVAWADNPDRPFCSERCRLIDLARWADGSYAVPGLPSPQTADEPEGE